MTIERKRDRTLLFDLAEDAKQTKDLSSDESAEVTRLAAARDALERATEKE
jgi:hypothetical protein